MKYLSQFGLWILKVIGYAILVLDDPSILLRWDHCGHCSCLEMHHANDDSKECMLCSCPRFKPLLQTHREMMEARRP